MRIEAFINVLCRINVEHDYGQKCKSAVLPSDRSDDYVVGGDGALWASSK